MHKRLLFLVLLAAGGAVHAQDALIPGRQLTAGKADARLAQMAREAAREHKVLVVNAPSYWQARIAKAIHAADPAADIRFNDSFFEHVLIRLSDRTAAAAAPLPPSHAPAPVVRAEPPRREARAAAPRPVEHEHAAVAAVLIPAPRPVTPAPQVAAHAPAPAAAPESAESALVAAASVAAAAPKPATKVDGPAARAPAPVLASVSTATPQTAPATERDSAAVVAGLKQEMEHVLNAGHASAGPLTEGQLQPGDVVYLNGDLRAVVRRDALGQAMYWLSGPANFERAQYRPLGQGRYEVIGSIDPMAPLQLRSGSDTAVFDSRLPAAASPARVQLQRLYADGRSVDSHLGVADLRSGDVLYTGADAALVVRQDSYGRSRYWLVGRVVLGQTGLQRIGPNVYRVIGIVK